MLIVDMSAVKLPGEAKQNNLPSEYGQPIDAGGIGFVVRRRRQLGYRGVNGEFMLTITRG
jgi:hypothetical protein